MPRGFTAAELAEMAAADAEIEASFRWTNEELALSRELDAEAALAAKDGQARKRAAYKKAYREANREKRAAQGRRIAAARRAAGYTQTALAKLLHMSQSELSKWETGVVPPRWELLRTVLTDLGEEAERMPDALRDAQDETPAAYCHRCGGEVWREEYRVRWDGKWICPDCFRAEVERMLDEEPEALADALQLDCEKMDVIEERSF